MLYYTNDMHVGHDPCKELVFGGHGLCNFTQALFTDSGNPTPIPLNKLTTHESLAGHADLLTCCIVTDRGKLTPIRPQMRLLPGIRLLARAQIHLQKLTRGFWLPQPKGFGAYDLIRLL